MSKLFEVWEELVRLRWKLEDAGMTPKDIEAHHEVVRLKHRAWHLFKTFPTPPTEDLIKLNLKLKAIRENRI